MPEPPLRAPRRRPARSLSIATPLRLVRSGGGFILFAPELHLGGDILVPDVAGWRRERLPNGVSGAFFTVAPDSICEVISNGTARIDRIRKMPRYAHAGVRHAWLVDPVQHTLEIFRLEGDPWTVIGPYEGEDLVRAEPFEAIEIELGALWEGVAPEATSG